MDNIVDNLRKCAIDTTLHQIAYDLSKVNHQYFQILTNMFFIHGHLALQETKDINALEKNVPVTPVFFIFL